MDDVKHEFYISSLPNSDSFVKIKVTIENEKHGEENGWKTKYWDLHLSYLQWLWFEVN